MLRTPHCLDNRLIDSGKVVSLTHQPRSTPQKHYHTQIIYNIHKSPEMHSFRVKAFLNPLNDNLNAVNSRRWFPYFTSWIQHRMNITASGCRSLDCLESVCAKTAAVSLPSAGCTGLVTARLPCARNVLPVVLTTVLYQSEFPRPCDIYEYS
jgi:hypothetical protein